MYDFKVECLGELEALSARGFIDLYYGDECGVSPEAYIPYGWQFEDEQVYTPSAKGKPINCFGLIGRNNQCSYMTTTTTIDTACILQHLDEFSLQLHKPTVVVLDNARVHTSSKFKGQLPIWQKRNLFVFYLPAYCPHLNLAETLWRKLKYEWLRPEDYRTVDDLYYAVNLALAAVGKTLKIQFSDFKYSLT